MYIELKTLETHNAGYHKKCYDKIGQKEYNGLLARVGKKPCSKANSSSSTVISHKRKKLSLEQSYNFFVERDSKKTCVLLESFTLVVLRIINMSRINWILERNCYNGDLEEHAKLCIGDVRSNEIFYHKNYLSPFHNRYRASKAKKDDGTDQCKKVLPQTYVWRQISNYIHHIDGCAQSLMHTT